MKYGRWGITLAIGLMLMGCEDFSLKEAECYNMAADRMDLYSSVASPDERKAAEEALYNKCLNEDNGYQFEVDNRNARTSGQSVQVAPDTITMQDQPPLIPPRPPQLQPYSSPNRELINILSKGN